MLKPDLRDLVQEGQIQEESGIGWDQVERLIKRAFEDLKSAERNMPFDEPGAMDFIYKAMFHAGNALIRSYGFRPGATRQHQGVIKAVGRILGSEYKASFSSLTSSENGAMNSNTRVFSPWAGKS